MKAIRTVFGKTYTYDANKIVLLPQEKIVMVDPINGISTDELKKAIENSLDIKLGIDPPIFTKSALKCLLKIKNVEKETGKNREEKDDMISAKHLLPL